MPVKPKKFRNPNIADSPKQNPRPDEPRHDVASLMRYDLITPPATEYLPTSVKEMKALGWDYVDIVIFSGDAYVDHPSFGAAVIGRVLQAAGYKVAIVPQPNWQGDLRLIITLQPVAAEAMMPIPPTDVTAHVRTIRLLCIQRYSGSYSPTHLLLPEVLRRLCDVLHITTIGRTGCVRHC